MLFNFKREGERNIMKKIISAVLSVTMVAGLVSAMPMSASADTVKAPSYMQDDDHKRPVEKLNRGLVATYCDANSANNVKKGVYLSWRLFGTESLTNQAFDIYRATSASANATFTKIATTDVHDPTNYVDTAGAKTYQYKVVPAGAEQAVVDAEKAVTPGTNHVAKSGGSSLANSFTYMDIPIEKPDPVNRMGDGKLSYYYALDKDHDGGANDASVGDIDGDGDYELILKWDPTDSKDSAGADFTGNCYIDAYEIDPNNDGSGNTDDHLYKWRIDLGQNVTSGAHYTQFIVYDFDNDGKAEIAMKTAPGTIDGTGHYVTEVGDTETIRSIDNTKSYIGTSGRLKGKNPFTQFLTVFDGETGKALATTEYIPYEMFGSAYWGDGSAKYNRSERYLAGVAYLDGVTPSIIMCRGYYHHAALRAYNWDGESLSMVWEHKGASKSATSMFGNGNHQLSISDIDNDGKDEIVYGSVALDDDGKNAMGNTFLGHGDAMHVKDFNNDGIQECFSVKEDGEGFKYYAEDLRVVSTGQHFWASGKITTSGDNGRGVMDNIDDAYALAHPTTGLALGWSSGKTMTHDFNGDDVAAKPANAGSGTFDNSLVYWDGDLGRELLDANIIQKYDATNGYSTRFWGESDGYTLTGGSTNNYSKRNASLTADLWGDWREEIIMPINKGDTAKKGYLRIFTSTIWTDYRLTTLMHDTQYRTAIAWQNVGYNQPPHTSYYVGSAALANDGTQNLNYLAPARPYDNVMYAEDVPSVDVEGITMTGEDGNAAGDVTIEKTKSYTYSAKVTPSEAKKKGIIWTTSDPSVATVKGGVVTAVGVGEATITATTSYNKDPGPFSESHKVTVWSTPVTGITVSGDGLVEITAGQSKKLTATVAPANASDQAVTWSSTNENVAKVAEDGTVTGISMGLATIYATTVEGGFKDACVVNVVPVTSVNKTGSNVFVTDNTDAESVLSGSTATGASFTQKNAAVGGKFYKTFEKIGNDKKAKLSFRYTTGGTKINGSDWNWDGHEFSFYVKLLDEAGNNLLSLWQPFTSSAGTLMNKAGNSAEASFVTEWSTVIDKLGDVQGSAKRWQVDIEFDYDNKTATAVLYGFGSGFEADPTAQYERTFDIPTDEDGNALNLGKLEISSTKDGEGTVYWTPKVEALSYEEIKPVKGSSSVLYRRGEKHNISWSDNDVSAASDGFSGTGSTLYYDDTSKRILFNPTNPGAAYSAAKSFNVTDDGTITYDIDWYFGNATGRTSNIEYLKIGSNLYLGWTSGYLTFVTTTVTDGKPVFDGIASDGTADKTKSIFTGSNTTFTKNVNVTFNIDKAAGKITIKSLKFDGAEVAGYADTELPAGATVDNVGFGFIRGGSVGAGYVIPCGIDNIAISQFVEGVDPTYNVKFVDIDGTVLQSKNVTVGTNATYTGEAVTRDADERYDSYVFKGWNPDPTTVKILDDTVFTAEYTTGTPRSYTVAFEENGGLVSGTAPTGYTYGTSVTLPAATKEGNTFAGWYDNENLEGNKVTEISATTYGDKTYYAKWDPIKYTVTLNTNGGTVVGDAITEYTYGTAVTLPTNYTKTGHTFAGWYDNENLTGDKVTEISATATGNKTYYAKWEPEIYNVTLHLFGGTVSQDVTSYSYGTAVTLPTPTKTGYTFDGWYSNSSYRTKASRIAATDTGDKNFYAKWTTTVPTIEFGSVGEDGKTVNAYFSSSKETDVIIGVLYDGTAVKEIKTAVATATNWAANTVYAKDIKFDNNVNNYDLKLFLWDSVSGIKPIAQTPAVRNKAVQQ